MPHQKLFIRRCIHIAQIRGIQMIKLPEELPFVHVQCSKALGLQFDTIRNGEIALGMELFMRKKSQEINEGD